MKKYIITFLISLSCLFPVGEAGAVFLLIAPGAGAAGVGEAQVAKADDAYASFYNPAGLGFINSTELAAMHVNWLPNLADDIYYEYLGYSRPIDGLGTLGGNFVFLNLGEQLETDELGNPGDTFKSYMWALTNSFGTMVSDNSSVGISFKLFQQKLADSGTGSGEEGDGSSTDFAFDVGYLGDFDFMRLGLSISNIGPKIDFIDADQADPAPTNMKLGIFSEVYNDGYNKINVLFDMNKMLVTRYQPMDWDGDGLVGGWNENGSNVGLVDGAYNQSGQQERGSTTGTSHFDEPFYKSIFTAWLDDWYFGGDYDYDGDGIIGGYNWNDYDKNGQFDEGETESNPNGLYSEDGQLEKGTGDDRKFSDEFKSAIYNFGVEYWYTENFALRAGYIYDYEGDIKNPTFGAGVRFAQYGFDFGYTAGEQGHPRANTMFFSITLGI